MQRFKNGLKNLSKTSLKPRNEYYALVYVISDIIMLMNVTDAELILRSVDARMKFDIYAMYNGRSVIYITCSYWLAMS